MTCPQSLSIRFLCTNPSLGESPQFVRQPEGEAEEREGAALVRRRQVRRDESQQRRDAQRDLKTRENECDEIERMHSAVNPNVISRTVLSVRPCVSCYLPSQNGVIVLLTTCPINQQQSNAKNEHANSPAEFPWLSCS